VRHLLYFLIVMSLFAGRVVPQDPLKVAPQAYKLEFYNDWVRVIRVHYAPHARIPVHDHPQWAAAYVYLNDSGEIIFKHIGPGSGPITRPPTKTGAFRLYRAVKEVHKVENPTDRPSDFLRVEFKTRVADAKSLRGRYYREDYPAGENYSKVQFENEQVRITRLVCAAGKTLDVSTSTGEPSLLVALEPAQLRLLGEKRRAANLRLRSGQTKWSEASQQEQIENTGTQAAEFLRFDFKTKPLRSVSKINEDH
jgi:hypothetical protein